MLRKDDHGNIVFACQSHCGSVHDFELAGDNLVKTDGLKLFGPGIGSPEIILLIPLYNFR